MGFLDKAKAAADQLAAKADTALSNSGLSGPAAANPEKLLRDLGVLAYLEETGRPASAEERERVLTALRGLESGGAQLNFTLHTAAPAPGTVPPPPGAGTAAPPPPPGGYAAQAADPVAAPDAGQAPPPPVPPAAPTTPPPPPPSWVTKDDGSA
ncbi:hypothetical protein [Nocardioides ferulae]|uniref:hypothetical protein n=1 Tax=Nocardioides ferulae TaxID=2340821 RepID=UPI000EB05619|nr:hypothetical protein [Nocardioides ferulae]